MRAQRRAAESEARLTDRAVAFRPLCGESVGAWRLRECVGHGGSAALWRAVDADGRVAALKIPRAGYGALVLREHAVLAAVRHPHIVATLGLVTEQDTPALVLEFLPGGDFVALAAGPPRRVLAALRGTLAALRALHAHGLAHCDVKARNVVFAADDTPRLIDFAAARPLDAPLRRSVATAACTPAGTAASGQAADVFAFAALVFEGLTGVLPYGRAGARWLGDSPQPCGALTPALAPLLRRATAALRANGRVVGALPAFAHDIESALAAHG
jgi:serine/threonine protein kinase